MTDAEVALYKLTDQLQADMRSIGSEARRRYPAVKEAADAAILKLRQVAAGSEMRKSLINWNNELLQPLILACNTKQNKLVVSALQSLHRLITIKLVTEESATAVVHAIWNLMEAGIEEVKLLQTAILLVTASTDIVRDRTLAKALVLAFRLNFHRSPTTTATAAAAVQQCLHSVFDRVSAETVSPESNFVEDQKKKVLGAAGRDALNLFADLCRLVNGEQPVWLLGLTDMTRTLGLNLLETCLSGYAHLFRDYNEFSLLLKDQVCPLVIKLFSPSLKHKPLDASDTSGAAGGGSVALASNSSGEKTSFSVSLRLVRLIQVIVQSYFDLLQTECEIFLSLVVRFLDMERPAWQRPLALETLCKFMSQPALVKNICSSYDLKPHSTKIFRDMVNAVSSFVQNCFFSLSSAQSGGLNMGSAHAQSGGKEVGVPPAIIGGLPVGAGVTPASSFIYRGNVLPIFNNSKPLFQEMLDRSEPDSPPVGYCVSVGFRALLEVIRSVSVLMNEEESSQGEELRSELLCAVWCGALAVLSLLLDSSSDESATEAILKAEETMVALCGAQNMTTPRDAFVTILCKSSLPSNYALAILASNAAVLGATANKGIGNRQTSTDEGLERSQVVVVGTALPTIHASGKNGGANVVSSNLGPVMLTAKNIQCMRAILSVAHCHGSVLGNAWHLVLTTLQHLVWILGLKPAGATGGLVPSSGLTAAAASASMVANNPSAGSGVDSSNGTNANSLTASLSGGVGSAIITTAVISDMPVLCSMLSRLFESSQYLDEVALHHLIDALCKLSSEAMEIGASNREPSLFAVAKILETGLVNMHRIEVFWKPVTAHLLEVCLQSHAGLRQMGADALIALVREATSSSKMTQSIWKDEKLAALVLHPLSEMSNVTHNDVRERQLQCVQHLLHSCGDQFKGNWQRLLLIIGAVKTNHGESLVRQAFHCLQLVITDYLGVISPSCYAVCVQVTATFAAQKQELNIALTAIGSLWHITDLFYQQSARLAEELPQSDALWSCVHMKLAELCVDARPSVRKSAGQTLFNTIGSHGALLQRETWSSVLWKVLFPLLESVTERTWAAATTDDSTQQSNSRGGAKVSQDTSSSNGNILIHHSRDTAAKQWAETQVLTLSGVAHVFTGRQDILPQLEDFPRAWKLLLECVETSALSTNQEIAYNALKSLQEMMTLQCDRDVLWSMTWQSWLKIGLSGARVRSCGHVPSQNFLTLFFRLFAELFAHIETQFGASDFAQFSVVLQQALVCPVSAEVAPFLLPTTYQEAALTPLQEIGHTTLESFQRAVLYGPEGLRCLLAPLFGQLLTLATFAVHCPKPGALPQSFSALNHNNTAAVGNGSNGVSSLPRTSVFVPSTKEYVPLNFVYFGERCLEISTDLYKECASHPQVISASILEQILKMLHQPLYLKYSCPSQSTWRLAITCLSTVLAAGLPVARQSSFQKLSKPAVEMDSGNKFDTWTAKLLGKHNRQDVAEEKNEFETMWDTLASTLEDFLFSSQKCPPGLSVEEFQEHEEIDCKLVNLIQKEFLSNSEGIPDRFIERMIGLLNRGSIHSTNVTSLADVEQCRFLREDLAQLCFETLLSYSFGSAEAEQRGAVSRAAVRAILARCRSLLVKFVADERLSGKCPLPRARLTELSLALKALHSLIVAFKAAPTSRIESSTWEGLLDCYPAVVDCIIPTASSFMRPLRDLLHQYRDLLHYDSQRSSTLSLGGTTTNNSTV